MYGKLLYKLATVTVRQCTHKKKSLTLRKKKKKPQNVTKT